MGLRHHFHSLFVLGEFESECYYCGEEISSRSWGIQNLKCSWHLAHDHENKDPDDIDDEILEQVYDEMFPDVEQEAQ